MNEKEAKKISKLLSFVLRHQPDVAHISLDEHGWTSVEILLANIPKYCHLKITFDELKYVVDTNTKKRFAFSEDFTHIRASQGHSVSIELGYEATTPPDYLYHGTATKFMAQIQEEGLKKMNRHHVHLSSDKETARNVGGRHGVPIILKVHALKMHQLGHIFFVSENNVWLTDDILPTFFEILQ